MDEEKSTIRFKIVMTMVEILIKSNVTNKIKKLKHNNKILTKHILSYFHEAQYNYLKFYYFFLSFNLNLFNKNKLSLLTNEIEMNKELS